MNRTFTLFLLLASFIAGAHQPDKAMLSTQMHVLSFIENKGQVVDQFGMPRTDIDFKLDADNGLNIFLSRNGLHYQWSENKVSVQLPFVTPHQLPASKNNMYRMDVELVGANANPAIVADEQQDYYERYYTIKATVHAYKKVVYKDVYPHIDWVIYLAQEEKENLAYDFIVHPGGNVQDIQIRYGGATQLKLDAERKLIATTPMGTISEQSPISYEKQSGKKINTSFVLNDNIVSFAITAGDYDKDATLVIDPPLAWSTYLGGTSNDYGRAVVCDKLANVYMFGQAWSNANIATRGSYISTNTFPSTDTYSFLAKFNDKGKMQWATYYYGMPANTIACDRDDNIYVSGTVDNSINGLATINAHQPAWGGGQDAYIAKFDNTGNVLWATYYGSTGTDQALGVACDTFGNVFLNGFSTSATGIATPGTHQPTKKGVYNFFIAKFNSSGNRLWGTYYGGNSIYGSPFVNIWYSGPSGIACDRMGNVFIASCTTDTIGIATPGAYQTTLHGDPAGIYDAFLVKFNGNGALQWGTYFGGQYSEFARAVTCDSTGAVYITGNTSSVTQIATPGAYQTLYSGDSTGAPGAGVGGSGGGQDGFLAKFNTNGVIQWSTYYGGLNSEYPEAITCSHGNNIYIAGETLSPNFITLPAIVPYQGSLLGAQDGFLAEFDAAGHIQYATYFGGPDEEAIYAVACDPYDNVYIAGRTSSETKIATPGAHQTTNGGGVEDAFLAKFGLNSFFLINNPHPVYCAGDTMHLDYKSGLIFLPGNVFTAQLSDAAGNFMNPVVVGTSTGIDDTGSIACAIPVNAVPGTHYRFRILSLLPADSTLADSIDVEIRPRVTAGFNYIEQLGCTSDKVIFTNSSSNATSYQWQFGDNTGNAVDNPIHVYAQQGTYRVTLIASNGVCTATDIQTINLDHPLQAIFTARDTICSGQSVTFSNTSKATAINNIAPSYYWTFGDGSTDTISNPVHLFGKAGVYKVMLAIYNAIPCFDTAYRTIVVDSPYYHEFMLSDSAMCTGDQLQLTCNCTDLTGHAIEWNMGDGTIVQNALHLQHSYGQGSKYLITLTTKSVGCPDTNYARNVTISPYPIVDIGPDTSLCPGQSPIALTNLADQSVTYTYLWSTKETSTGILTHVPDVYWLTVTTPQGCATTDTAIVRPDCYIHIPNAFSPNGDGINDYFFPRQLLSMGLVSFHMQIFNRWGTEIFTTNTIEGRGWDGSFNGAAQSEGVYIYVIEAAFENSIQTKYQGNVTLIR